jgi:hypothetical protein
MVHTDGRMVIGMPKGHQKALSAQKIRMAPRAHLRRRPIQFPNLRIGRREGLGVRVLSDVVTYRGFETQGFLFAQDATHDAYPAVFVRGGEARVMVVWGCRDLCKGDLGHGFAAEVAQLLDFFA